MRHLGRGDCIYCALVDLSFGEVPELLRIRSWCLGSVTIVGVCGGGESPMLAVCVGALTMVRALDGGGDNFEVTIGGFAMGVW